MLDTMPRPKSDNTFQVAFKIPEEWVRMADGVAQSRSHDGAQLTRTDGLRMALYQGLRYLERGGDGDHSRDSENIFYDIALGEIPVEATERELPVLDRLRSAAKAWMRAKEAVRYTEAHREIALAEFAAKQAFFDYRSAFVNAAVSEVERVHATRGRAAIEAIEAVTKILRREERKQPGTKAPKKSPKK